MQLIQQLMQKIDAGGTGSDSSQAGNSNDGGQSGGANNAADGSGGRHTCPATVQQSDESAGGQGSGCNG